MMPKFLRWSAYRLRTKGLIVVGLPLLPLAVFWLAVVLALLRQPRPINTEARTLSIQAGLARVFSDLLDADAGARNYLLTESEPSLTRYSAAVERLPANLASLQNAVIDETLRESLGSLQTIVDDEVATLGRMTGAASPTLPAISEVGALNRSASNLDRIRALSLTMERRQAAISSAQNIERQRTRMLYFFGFLAGSVVCAGGGVMAAIVLARGVSRRASALASNADRLARGLPPEPLPVGEDEIGLVDARIRAAARLLRRRDVELLERTTQLETANRELEAFSYSVSHDLRAPLRAIDGFSEALEIDCGDELSEGARDSLRRVRAAAGRMSTLIDELLNLSRLSRMELTRAPVDLGESASAILADLSKRCPGRAVDLQIASGLIAQADHEMVQIALQNLIDNAWKYTSKTVCARIEVGASPNGAVRVFHVRDNGAGFDMAHATRLFGAFQRLHHDRDFEGTGIGLAIVHRIISRHGGRIWAEGAVGAGATFYFTLEPDPG
jgi:signal transduction histidine kinase